MAKVEASHLEFPIATKAGVLLALGLALWGVVEYFGFESSYQRENRDPYRVAAQAARFKGFNEMVAPDAILGYFTDLEPGSATDDAMFQTAQYAVAPRIIQKEINHPKVLGNFTRPANFADVARKNGLVFERDFGNGVVLFRREAR